MAWNREDLDTEHKKICFLIFGTEVKEEKNTSTRLYPILLSVVCYYSLEDSGTENSHWSGQRQTSTQYWLLKEASCYPRVNLPSWVHTINCETPSTVQTASISAITLCLSDCDMFSEADGVSFINRTSTRWLEKLMPVLSGTEETFLYAKTTC